MKIVILEDEPLMALDLAADLQILRPQWQVVKTLSSVKQALAWLQTADKVDLIFSDIQLGDGTCFDAFAQIAPTAPVIFCTAYDQYAVQAFQANGIGYLLKPFGRESLLAAVEKFERLQPAQPDIAALLKMLSPKTEAAHPGRILVHHKDKIIPVPIADIALFYLHHEQVMLLRLDGQKFPVQQGLSELETLVGNDFFRASRQHLVQRQAVLEATQYFARKLLLRLTVPFEEEVTISKEKVPAFLEWLA
jgi:two-component system, LytTR family, response regulator LytT